MRSTSWIRFTVVLAARGVVATVFGLLFWAAAPMLIGWHSTTVMTGSMEPSLHVGDVVVSKPVAPRELRRGQVLLFDDPDHAGVLRLHRFDALGSDGTLTTKGDANPQADSTPITRSAVHGVGYLRVPLIGAPITWAAAGDTAALPGLGAALLAVTALAVTPAVSGGRPPAGPASRRARHRASPRRPRTATAVVVAAVCVAGALALPAPAAAAGFTATTPSATSTLATATATPVTALTCATNSDGSVSIGWGYAGTAPERFTVLVDGQAVTQRPADARSTTLGSWDLFTWRTSTVSIRTDLTSTWTATSTDTVRVVTVRFLGFGRTSCA
ncbi:signal peptidase I [Curtobacterium sp. MCSS17_008]|uniref:signal peptidase I n=1 Tax=Curtobacterium sp. MCSS17_008 TaxID=2175647 RepID=UPI000DA88A22|nr:signal peptidase I [Curtobacterium sp. MCSS17_008]PZF55582.1 signal peptidase I [Curtobacterium sp. MCSS17_008]